MAGARRSGAQSWVTRLIPQLVSLSLLLLLAAVYLNPAPFHAADSKYRLRNRAFDPLQGLKPRTYQPAGVWILDIDEKSLSRFGQWPWPREVLASILSKLAEYEVAAIGFDMVLAEPDRTSPARALAPYADKLGIADKLEALPDHDALFAETLRRVPAGLGLAPARNHT